MKSERRAGTRERRGLIVSLLAVVVISVGTFAATMFASWSPKLGLDLAGGLSVVYQPAHAINAGQMAEEIAILTNRVNASGVSGATVQQQGQNIAVTVPGAKDAQAILQTLGSTAQLFLRPVLCYAPPLNTDPKKQVPAGTKVLPCRSQYAVTTANAQTPNASIDPLFGYYHSTEPANDVQSSTVILPGIGSQIRYVLGPAPLTGRIIANATAQVDQTNQWVVSCNLTPVGSAGWDVMAQQNFHKPVAIELDGVVQSAPIILPGQATFSSFGGTLQISGGFTQTQATALATVLTYGSLPVALNELQAQTVSPTLGHSSLVAGLGAGIAGLIIVLLYVIAYYRALGLVIVSGLALTGALLYAIISALGHTSLAPSFTLAGVTGLIVSIGITVDSYIVYFERLKDETRSGRTVRTSVDRGFKSAWRTVLAADLVSLIAAVLLYELALGDVRGFAFFLGLSTFLDIAVTWFYTRPLVYLLGRSEGAQTGGRFGVARGLAVEGGAK